MVCYFQVYLKVTYSFFFRIFSIIIKVQVIINY